MYLLPNEAMELLQITTRQGLHKVVVNHNITVKSQGAGKPNLYLKYDLERYKKDNAKNIEKKKNPQVIEKAEKIVKKQNIKKEKHLKVKSQVKKEVDTEIEKDFKVTEIREQKEKEIKKDLELPNDEEIESPLNKVGMAEFQRVTDLLIEQGTYKEVDRALVLAYAISYQKYIFSTVASAKMDDTTMNDFGDLKIHPYFQVADKCLTQMNKLATMIGIGSRSRIGLELTKPRKLTFADIIANTEDFN